MSRLPRGFKVTGERVEDGNLVIEVRISRWRAFLLAWKAARCGFRASVE